MIDTFQLNLPGINTQLSSGFEKYRDDTSIKRSHLFNGRYENIYLTEQQVPALATLLAVANEHARNIMQQKNIRSGCWFNDMPPGATTTKHSHDDDDELLSAVYYVSVPAESGDLILYDKDTETRIIPSAGQMIFFPPDIDHEVTTNNSSEHRLSIGINFGPAED